MNVVSRVPPEMINDKDKWSSDLYLVISFFAKFILLNSFHSSELVCFYFRIPTPYVSKPFDSFIAFLPKALKTETYSKVLSIKNTKKHLKNTNLSILIYLSICLIQ